MTTSMVRLKNKNNNNNKTVSYAKISPMVNPRDIAGSVEEEETRKML